MAKDVVHIRPGKVEPLKVGDKTFKSAYDWELTEKDLEKAALELGETDEKKKECLQKLKEKLSKESSVKYRQDDFYLLCFLRVGKYDVKKAYHRIKRHFEERKKHSNFFFLPQDLKSLLDLNCSTVLPYSDEEGRILVWLNAKKWDPAERSFEEMVQSAIPLADIVSMNPHTQINGTIGVWDMSQTTMRHVSESLWNGQLLTYFSFLQNGYPWRVKKVVIINTNQLVRFVYSILRPLLTRKIRERVLLLGSDLTELHQHIDPALLPESLKGTLKDEECSIMQHILDNLPYLEYERTFIFE